MISNFNLKLFGFQKNYSKNQKFNKLVDWGQLTSHYAEYNMTL